MRNVNEIASSVVGGKPGQVGHSKPTGDMPRMSRKWTAALFAKLQARYGAKWSSSHPTEDMAALAMNEWAEGLAGYTGEEVARGLAVWNEDWPPSLPEFKRACRPARHAAHKTYQALPKPAGNPEVAASALTKMKEALK